MRRILRRVGLVLGLLVLAGAGYMVWMIGPRDIIGFLRYDQRREGSLQTGDEAPDVMVYGLDRSKRLLLGDRPDCRPLVLVFGSFT